MIARARVIFRGLVQGVYFRAHCQQKATELGLRGYVRNLRDGTVEAVFEGERHVIEDAIEWNASHQPQARVKHADVRWETPTEEFKEFGVRH
ncbi:MAG TPA: acylphosphatase [Thermoplasmata archaeon]|nr:acylphosphatase [Thermoplasmata archaeon]